MYKYSVSVRAYWVGVRRGYNLTTQAGCIEAAEDLLKRPCVGGGKRTVTELFRAGGLGVCQICKRLGTKNPEEIKRVKSLCSRIDYELHVAP